MKLGTTRCAAVAAASLALLGTTSLQANAAETATTTDIAVNNSSFEAPIAWTPSRPGLDVVRTAAAHSGTRALLLYARTTGAAYTSPAASLVTETTRGSTYRLSAYISANVAAVPAEVSVLEKSGGTVVARHSVAVTARSGDWQKIDLEHLATTTGGQLTVELGSTSLARSAGIRLDDMSLSKSTPLAPRTKFGVSANLPSAGQSFAQRYQEQMQAPVAAKGLFYYFPGGVNPTWNANLQAVPSDQDVVISTKVFDAAANAAFAAQVPRDRTGRVFYHYWQEPEDDMTPAVYRERASTVAKAVASNPRITFGVELMAYDFNPRSGRNWREWMVPEVKHLGVSLYAKSGNGVTIVQDVAAAAKSLGIEWGADAWGYALPAGATSAERDTRAQWVTTTGTLMKQLGATHADWFNTTWSNGDYLLTSDPKLLSAWQAVTAP